MGSQGKTFIGWNTNANGSGTPYEAGAEYTVTGNITLYAQWEVVPIVPEGSTFEEKLAYIANNAGDGIVYEIVVHENITINPVTVSTLGRNITVFIRSESSTDVKTVQLYNQGYLLSVDNNITLKLQDIVVRGTNINNRALVSVGIGGKLILNSGAKITMNTNTTTGGEGSGVCVNGGILEINDGAEISNNANPNASARGGGIHVKTRGTVNIFGGLITQNTVNINPGYGGGISITTNSTVNMYGGTISKCSARAGGAIHIDANSVFTKRAALGSSTSGIIYGSTESENANEAVYGSIRHEFRSRYSTLGYYDEISTVNDVGWE